MGDGRDYGSSELGPDLVLLEHEVEACPVGLVLVQDTAGVVLVDNHPFLVEVPVVLVEILHCAGVIGVLLGLVLAPFVLVVGLEIEACSERLCIDHPSADG